MHSAAAMLRESRDRRRELLSFDAISLR